jgi:hypothetical protein
VYFHTTTFRSRGTPDKARSESIIAVNPNDQNNIIAASKKFSDPDAYRFTIGIRVSLVDTTGTLSVALICPAPLSNNNTSAIPDKSGDLDRVNGNIIEKRPIKIFTPTHLSPRRLSRKTRKPK